jgi:hypothetical protein
VPEGDIWRLRADCKRAAAQNNACRPLKEILLAARCTGSSHAPVRDRVCCLCTRATVTVLSWKWRDRTRTARSSSVTQVRSCDSTMPDRSILRRGRGRDTTDQTESPTGLRSWSAGAAVHDSARIAISGHDDFPDFLLREGFGRNTQGRQGSGCTHHRAPGYHFLSTIQDDPGTMTAPTDGAWDLQQGARARATCR